MSDSAKQAAAIQNLVEAGQAFAKRYFEFVTQQQSVLQAQASTMPNFGLPATEEMTRLQQEHMDRHAKLWTTLVQERESGEAPPPAVANITPSDKRFKAPEWGASPFYDYLRQSYLINAETMQRVVEALPISDGVAKNRLRFLTRQFVDAMAPSNFAATNPEFIKVALETKGESIKAGIKNLLADLDKGRISTTDESVFEVGGNLAVTPGQVIYENELIQLIQYSPSTDKVAERPLVIIPPCINKFYILDLQPENSYVRYIVSQGHTVFLVSWRNPKVDLSHLTWDDYLEQGVLTALSVARRVCGVEQVNTLGFCIGGTLLASALSVAAARGEAPAASLTLLTTLLDFSDAGELGYFVDEASIAGREVAIGKGGLLKGSEFSNIFSSLRANDLVWQYVVGNYLKGRQPDAFDLLYWNADSTNLPGPFMVYYLRQMYLNNSLRVPGKLEMSGVRVDLTRVNMPTYILATKEDHIVPWRSAYISRQLLGGDTNFVLGASGHIAGVVNPAEKNRRSYWHNPEPLADAEAWLAGAQESKGSWWVHWIEWLNKFSGDKRPARKKLGDKVYKAIEPAPGRYVKERA